MYYYTMDPFSNHSVAHFPSGNLARPNLNNLELLGKGWNRWQYLFFDPQKNCIEPFPRIGNNSVLQTLDSYQAMCESKYRDSQRIRPQ